MVSKFAHSLRINIFEEHCGCAVGDPRLLDPLDDHFNEIWNAVATHNTLFYRQVFRCYPDDEMNSIKVKSHFEAAAEPGKYNELKDSVKGHLVDFPLLFLADEDLRIKVFNMEYYVPDESFI